MFSRTKKQVTSEIPAELDRIAEEFIAARRRGENVTVEQTAERHPDLHSQIIEMFPALELLEDTAQVDGQLPEEIGPYRIVDLLGRGGMGVVYRAVQPGLDRAVALKVLPGIKLGSEQDRRRFELEARAAAKLRHPHIVPVHDVGSTADVLYYSMQLIPGFSLRQLIENQRLKNSEALKSTDVVDNLASTLAANENRVSLPSVRQFASAGESADAHAFELEDTFTSEHWDFAAGLGRDVARALKHAHEQGVIHRDVKPANVLLDETGRAWITDFGLAKVADTDLTVTGMVLGTARYMAPEQFDGKAEQRSDQYSLGATLYELLSLSLVNRGQSPSGVQRQASSYRPVEFPEAVQRLIPRDLKTIVERCMRPNPEERYADMEAVASDLERFLERKPILARQATLGETARWWLHEHKVSVLSVATVLAVLLAATLALMFVFRSPPEDRVLVGDTWLYPNGNDRQVAERVFEVGGVIHFQSAAGVDFASSKEELPDSLFNVCTIKLDGCQQLSQELIREIGRLSSLNDIYFNHSNFEAAWLPDICESETVISLQLNFCNLDDSALERIGQETQLVHLGLNGNQITDAGLSRLCEIVQLLELKLLWNPGVTDAGLEALKCHDFLELVDVRDNPISDEAAESFRRHMLRTVPEPVFLYGDSE